MNANHKILLINNRAALEQDLNDFEEDWGDEEWRRRKRGLLPAIVTLLAACVLLGAILWAGLR